MRTPGRILVKGGEPLKIPQDTEVAGKKQFLASYRAALRDARQIGAVRGIGAGVDVLLTDLLGDATDMAKDSLTEQRASRSRARARKATTA